MNKPPMYRTLPLLSLRLLLPLLGCAAPLHALAAAATPATPASTPASTPAAASSAQSRQIEQSGLPELPLPQVPATLRTPSERAAYIVSHFWDALDFADTVRSHNRGFMEQNFVNCLSLFPIADTAALAPAVGAAVALAQSDAGALSLLAEIAEQYLYEQDSPLFNEEYYLLFADALAAAPLPDYTLLRIDAQRSAMRRNRRGTVAADFAFETPDGKRMRLSDIARGRQVLLLFYDPDCGHCMETVAELAAMAPLNDAVARGGMAVVAVYAGFGSSARTSWRRTLDRLPAEWIAGFDDGSVYARDLYVLRSLPALYLLDPTRRVLLKDASPERIAAALGN